MCRNCGKLRKDLIHIDETVDSMAGDAEKKINQFIARELSSYKADLGSIGFRGQRFKASIEAEGAISHGRNCNMHLTSGPIETELGDLIILVDHILDMHDGSRKIINGASSIIQTKKEEYAKSGLSARQLYLMTQWPKFDYKGLSCEAKIFPDTFAFYLFVLSPSAAEEPKSSIISSSMVTKLLQVNKLDLLNNIRGYIAFSNTNILRKEDVYGWPLPLFIAPYLIRALCLSLGSPSIEFRTFLKQTFFPSMEEVEDCELVTKTQGPKMHTGNKWPPKNQLLERKDDDILAVRLKVTLGRME